MSDDRAHTFSFPPGAVHNLLIVILAGGGSFVGGAISATDSAVLEAKVSQLTERVADLRSEVRTLSANLAETQEGRYTRYEAERELSSVEARILTLERAHPELYRDR